MALPPVSFNVPQRRVSPIEEAFAAALATVAAQAVGAPFEKARERRAEARDIRSDTRDLERRVVEMGLARDIGIQTQKSLAEQERGFRIEEGSLIPITPAIRERLPDLPESQKYGARKEVLPPGPGQLDLRSRILGLTGTGGITAPRTQEEAAATVPELQTLVSAYGTSVAGGASREDRRANLSLRLADLLGQGSAARLTRAAKGEVWGKQVSPGVVKAFTPEESELVDVPLQSLRALRQSGDFPEFADLLDEMIVTKEGIGTPAAMNVLPQAAVDEHLRQMTSDKKYGLDWGMVGLQNRAVYEIEGGESKPITEPDQAAAKLAANRDLSAALYVYNHFAGNQNGINAVVENEMISGAVRLNARAKGYLSFLFKQEGAQNYLWPGMTEEQLPDELRGAPVEQGTAGKVWSWLQRAASWKFGEAELGGVLGKAPSFPAPVRTAPEKAPGLVAPSYELTGKSEDYAKAFTGFYTAYAKDSTQYYRDLDSINVHFSTPESAAEWLRRGGTPEADSILTALTKGDNRERARVIAYNNLVSMLKHARQVAREQKNK